MERWMRVPFWSGLATVVAALALGGRDDDGAERRAPRPGAGDAGVHEREPDREVQRR